MNAWEYSNKSSNKGPLKAWGQFKKLKVTNKTTIVYHKPFLLSYFAHTIWSTNHGNFQKSTHFFWNRDTIEDSWCMLSSMYRPTWMILLINIWFIWMFPKIVGFPPKSCILIGFSIINHPFWGTPIFGNTHYRFKNHTNHTNLVPKRETPQ